MEIVSEIPNLKTAQENHNREAEKYNYYRKINDEDWQIINRRNEYYKFLLQCVQTCYKNISESDINKNIDKINDKYDFNIFNADVIEEIKEFLQLNNIGKIINENFIICEHCEYTSIEIKFDCSFDEFFNAFYGEIQFIEYYEITALEAQKKQQEFINRWANKSPEQIYNELSEDTLLGELNNSGNPTNSENIYDKLKRGATFTGRVK